MIALGIIGWPLDLTLSPKLHEHLFKVADLSGKYDTLPIQKLDSSKLDELIDEYVGLNVTVPHKQSIYEELASTSISSDSVRVIGAANTIVVNNGSTSLHNTDYKGFLAEVSRLNYKTENKTVLILGSGGSSKSIKYALTRLNPKEVYVASRNPNGKQLGYSDLSLIKEKVNMIVNTTPLGMPPYEKKNPLEADIEFKNLEILIDIGYSKRESNLMKRYKDVEIVNGLGMLIAQGIESFNLWTKSKLIFSELYMEIKELLEEEIYD